MLHEVIGNLVTDKSINVFCHQTNCQGRMGAGIAKAIAEAYPVVAQKDRMYCATPSRKLLGTNLYVPVTGTRTCVNMYAQFNYGKNKCYTEYDKLQQCLDRLARKLNVSDASLKVGFPAGMSCGNAGGDWNIVKEMLLSFADDIKQDVYIVSLNQGQLNVVSVTANFVGKSSNIANQWHSITIHVLPKSYLVRCGKAEKYYFSRESLWADWFCYEKIELPNLVLRS